MDATQLALEVMVNSGLATYDPKTKKYTLTEAGKRFNVKKK